jgi:hypothetical protein
VQADEFSKQVLTSDAVTPPDVKGWSYAVWTLASNGTSLVTFSDIAQNDVILREFSVPFAVHCGASQKFVVPVNFEPADFGLFDAINYPVLRPGTVTYVPCP